MFYMQVLRGVSCTVRSCGIAYWGHRSPRTRSKTSTASAGSQRILSAGRRLDGEHVHRRMGGNGFFSSFRGPTPRGRPFSTYDFEQIHACTCECAEAFFSQDVAGFTVLKFCSDLRCRSNQCSVEVDACSLQMTSIMDFFFKSKCKFQALSQGLASLRFLYNISSQGVLEQSLVTKTIKCCMFEIATNLRHDLKRGSRV